MPGTERRTCEAECNEPATHRLENGGGEHLFVCPSCADVFGGEGTDVTSLPDGRRYVYTGTHAETGTEPADSVDGGSE